MSGWCTIESDPGVFTEMIEKFGVKGLEVKEVFDLEGLNQLKPVIGLIFLFKYVPGQKKQEESFVSYDENVFFANQTINNACATQAILQILLNSNNIELGEELGQFKAFTSQFPSDIKGEAISNSHLIRDVHNSFSRSDPFQSDETKVATEDDDVFHFVAYVPVGGKLYELDGLQSGPIYHGDCTDENWVEVARPIIEKRISTYATSEIRFNLMGIIKSRLEIYKEKLLTLPVDAPQYEKDDLKEMIKQEENVRERWQKENKRRRGNYVGFIYTLLNEMAKKGLLDDTVVE